MRKGARAVWLLALLALLAAPAGVGGCGGAEAGTEAATGAGGTGPRILAAESFLADIAQNVAGERLTVDVLVPSGTDPHAFQPTPADVKRVVTAGALIVNGAGLEAFLGDLLAASGTQARVIEAAAGLQPRAGETGGAAGEPDPHFWLNPVMVKAYVENIRIGLTEIDPAGAAVFRQNAEGYQSKLDELDAWITSAVEQVPPERRLLVTNHESLGYFADRYGFQLVGALLPGITSSASPSAQDLVRLEEDIRRLGVRAVVLETGADPKLAEQVARDTGVVVVSDVYTHSLSAADGPASSYLAMMRHNATVIVDALR